MFVEYETAKGFNHRAKNLLQTIGKTEKLKTGKPLQQILTGIKSITYFNTE